MIKKFLPYYKRNLALAFPIILAQVGQATVQLTDTFMVGFLGTVELAAVAFANSIFLLVFIFGLGFSLGQTPHIGKAYGKKQWRKIGLLFQNALLINTVLGIIVFILMRISAPLLYHLNQPVHVVSLAMPFFSWLLASNIPLLIFFTCRQFTEGIGNTKIAMWITLIGNVINIFFNYVLIFGKFGFPAFGVEGSGIATFITRVLMAIIFVILIFRHQVIKKFTQYFSWENFSFPAIKRLVATGFPISGQLLVETLAFSLSAIMIGWINEVNLAAHQIVLQMASTTFLMALGVGSACTIRISHQFGSKHYKAARMASTASLHLVTAFMALTAIGFITLRHQIPSWFSSDPEVIAVAAQLCIIAGIFQLFDGWQTVGLATLRGLTDVTFALFIAFTSYIVIALPIGYMLGFVLHWGSVGIWTGLSIGLVIAAVAYRLRFLYVMKKITNCEFRIQN